MRKPSASPTDSGHISQHDSAVAKQQLEEWLDEALADTFPASDPIASPPGGGASDWRAPTRDGEFQRHVTQRSKGDSQMSSHQVPHETKVVVRGSGRGFAQEISARSHRLLADEPIPNGGTDTGPTPYDLLLAALGS